ncbi:MAG: GDSL family lipase [Mariniphaga sp.]|nr:GDSL family lipase [Mariniphaga sp.]
MKLFRIYLLLGLLFSLFSCTQQIQFFDAENNLISYQGRIDFDNPAEPILIGSASYLEINFTGDSCLIMLQNMNTPAMYNFISIELDGQYMGRLKITSDSMTVYSFVPEAKKETHNLRILKATEASNGTIVFGGVQAFGLEELETLPDRKIEFIGNSITCGMGVDWKEIPCNTGQWYDQHNAYFAYGPQSAMKLDAQFMLSSVSGIGIYRNWNSLRPVMPDVYENMYLNTDVSKQWDFISYTPDLVSICLGTNDFSDGDGINERLPFDSAQYVSRYIDFVETVYSYYPETQVCLLTSPMVNGGKAKIFERCISSVKNHFDEAKPDKKSIAIYFFDGLTPHGCDSHPDREDQQEMANRLVPFYKEVMGW